MPAYPTPTGELLRSLRPATNRVGRPTKFSAKVVQALCDALADGMPIKGACVVAGIAVSTLAEWREKYPQIEERMNEARELARHKALQSIKAAGEKDWRASAEWLRMTHPAEYRGGNKIEVNASASVSTVVMTEERRMELIDRRNRLLELEREPPPPLE